MKIETSELEGAALDWAVAKCEGWNPLWDETLEDFFLSDRPECFTRLREFHPSANWAQGGPIIEREALRIEPMLDDTSPKHKNGFHKNPEDWCAFYVPNDDISGEGGTILIAAMRCYVASKLGGEVDIPEEMLHV